LFARRVGALGLKPLDIATGQTTAGAIYLVPIALFFDRPWSLPIPSAPVIASVFAIAALCTALAYVVYFRILSGAGATNVLLVTLVAPATSVILGALILHERLLARQFVGFAIIALGLAFIDGRLPRAMLAGNSNLGPQNPRLPTGQKPR
jgi:drug/metabolite transporter (DMT)-like permease